MAVIVLCLSIFSTTTFAQAPPGGAADGSGVPPTDASPGSGIAVQPTGIHFFRNNGDGTCGMQAQIRLYYTTAPTAQPMLTQIYYDGVPFYSNFTPIPGNITDFASKGYVSFCLPTSNIPPAIKLTLTYNASSTQQGIIISGTD